MSESPDIEPITPNIEPIQPPGADEKEDAPMEIHKPKPVHSWRELLTEISVVVIGVIIALSAEQGVEYIHWRNQVAEARGLLGNELASSMSVAIYRVRLENCIESRLDALTSIVDGTSRSGSLPPVPQIGNAPGEEWPDDVWHAVVASQTATHFPSDTLNAISSAYTQVAELRNWNQAELLAWTRLSTMVGPGRRLDPASETELRSALSEARLYDRISALAGGQLVEKIESLHLPVTQDAQKDIDNALHFRLSDYPVCKALGADVPSLYGQAPFSAYLSMIQDWLKHPPYTLKGH